MRTVEQYDLIFEKERHHNYPIVDVYERMCGHAIDRDKLESMARTLACPLKVNPPNWQHGRVLYTTLRHFLTDVFSPPIGQCPTLYDIGTAKGFSACVMGHAIADAGRSCRIVSIDLVDPDDRVERNSVAEISEPKTVHEFVLDHMPASVAVRFVGGGSRRHLEIALDVAPDARARIPFAFVDGKHTYDQVRYEGIAMRNLQRTGDVVMFDDCQIEPVGRAVRELIGYKVRYLDIGPRVYAIATRR